MTKFVSLTLHSSASTRDPLSIRLRVPKDWLSKHAPGVVNPTHESLESLGPFSLPIRRIDIVQWFLDQGPASFLILECFAFKVNIAPAILIEFVDKIDGPHLNDAIQLSASVMVKFDDKSTDSDYHATIVSGGVRLITRDGFLKANSSPPNKFFSMNDAQFTKWRHALWQEDNVEVAGISFGANDLDLELLEKEKVPGLPQRRRVSLLIDNNAFQRWRLSDCGGEAFVSSSQKLASYREEVKRILLDSSIQVINRPALQYDVGAAVFYQRNVKQAKPRVEMFMRPNFALRFRDGENQGHWTPRSLQDIDSRLILTDRDLINSAELADLPDAALVPDTTKPAHPVIHWKKGKLAGVENIPLLKCVGISGNILQAGYLWQYGRITPHAPSLSTEMGGWTRFHIPDAGDAESLPSGNVLRLPSGSGSDNPGWRLDVGSDMLDADAIPLDLKLTIDTKSLSFDLEVLSGKIVAYSPEFDSYSHRLQDPSAPPNTKRLEGALKKARLVFAPMIDDQSIFNDHSSHTALPLIEIQLGGVLEFKMACKYQAVVTFAPFVGDAGIDFLSAGSTNLVQAQDPQTLRMIVERDTTHTLMPFEITSCRLQMTESKLVELQSVNYDNSDSSIAAAMALAPWVGMSDHVTYDAANDITELPKKRQLFHRNLVLEHGELATASTDRSIDGSPNALVGSVREFMDSVRDDYAIAVTNLLASEGEAAEIENWLPGAEVIDGQSPSAWIDYKGSLDDLNARAPVVKLKMPEFGQVQELNITSDEAGTEQQDWLTCDVRLKSVDIKKKGGKDFPVPQIAISVADSGDFDFDDGSSRARNGSVPLLFDGADFVSCTGDSRSGDVLPLPWFVAELTNGDLSVVDRLTGKRLSLLKPKDNQPAVTIGAGQSVDTNWIVRVSGNGNVEAWLNNNDSDWPTDSIIVGSAGIAAETANVSAHESVVCVLVASTSEEQARLMFWSPMETISDTNPAVFDPAAGGTFNPSAADNWTLLLYDPDTVFLAATVSNAPSIVLRGLKSSGTWVFTLLTLENKADTTQPLDSPAAKVSLARYGNSIAFVTLSEKRKHWSLGEIDVGRDKVLQLDSVKLSEEAVSICLQNRPAGIDGLPVGCRPLWVCVANDAGSIDVWLSTKEPQLRSIQSTLAVDLEDFQRQPYYRLEGHSGTINGFDFCLLKIMTSTSRSDLHSGLVTCGSDGTTRLWDLDASRLVCSHRDSHWMMDNLGTLRSTADKTAEPGRVIITPVSRPKDPCATRGSDGASHEEAGSTISISYVPNATDACRIVSDNTRQEVATEICFSCEGLRLKKSDDLWKPEWVEEEPTEDANKNAALLTSRGYFGVFGFFSTIVGKTPVTSYLPRVAGVPVFIHEIVAMTFFEDVANSGKIKTMTLNGALINPLLLDGTASTASDDLKGQLPAPIAQAITEKSLIQIQLRSEGNGNLEVISVTGIPDGESGHQSIKWNMLVADSTSDSSESGFDGLLESIEFKVSYDKELPRILLEISNNSRARLLGGSHPLTPVSDQSVVLGGYGVGPDEKVLYGFETLWELAKRSDDDAAIDSIQSPMLSVSEPHYVFSNIPKEEVVCVTSGANLGMNDAVTIHKGESGQNSQVCWWDMLTGRRFRRDLIGTDHIIQQAAVGRAIIPTLIAPISTERFELGIADLETGKADLQACLPACRSGNLNSVVHDVSITKSCLVSDHRKTYLVTGDEAGEIRIWDALIGKKLRQINIAAGAVTALVGTGHQGKSYVAAIIDGRGYVIDVGDGILTEVPTIDSDNPIITSDLTSIDLGSFGSALWFVAGTVDDKQLIWIVGEQKPPLILKSPDIPGPIVSVAVGLFNNKPASFVACNDNIRCFTLNSDGSLDHRIEVLAESGAGKEASLKFCSHDAQFQFLVAAVPNGDLRWFTPNLLNLLDKWVLITHHDKAPLLTDIDIQIVRTSTTSMAVVGPGRNTMASDKGISEARAFDLLDPKKSVLFTLRSNAQKPVPFAAGGVWAPHLATVDGSKTIRVVDLNTGKTRATLAASSEVTRVEFAEQPAGSGSIIIGFEAAAVRTWKMINWTKAGSIDTTGTIEAATVSQGFGLLTDGDGAMLWPIGSELEPDEHIRWKDARWGDPLTFDFASFDLQSNNEVIEVIVALKLKGSNTCHLYTILDKEVKKSNEISLADSIIPLDVLNLSRRPHLLTSTKESSGETSLSLWSFSDKLARPLHRWAFKTGDFLIHSVVAKAKDSVQILVASSGKLGVWSIDGLIQLDETGRVRADSEVSLGISDADALGFDVHARVCHDGSVGLTNKSTSNDGRTPMLAGLYRQGMYALLLDPLMGGSAATGILTLWREVGDKLVDGKLAGTVTQVNHRLDNTKVSIVKQDDSIMSFNANFNRVELRSRLFGRGEENRQEIVIGGVLTLGLGEGQTAHIFFSDQLITFRKDSLGKDLLAYDLTGFLVLDTNSKVFQGPLRCQCTFKDDLTEISAFEILPCLYRTVPVKTSADVDPINLDAAFADPDLRFVTTINLAPSDTSNGCGLRMMLVSNDNEQQQKVKAFKLEFESKKQECAVLIVNSTSTPDKWKIAGFDDAGIFNEPLIDDPSDELSVELKKEPPNKSKIIELVTSRLGRTPSNPKSELFVQFVGVEETSTIKIVELSSEMVPVDMCLDSEARMPFGIASPHIARLSHLQGLGSRLRFAPVLAALIDVKPEIDTLSVDKTKDNLSADETVNWLIQPVLADVSGARILDIGVVAAQFQEGQNAKHSTENILAVTRPPMGGTDRSLMECLASTTGEIDRMALFDPQDFAQYSLNRWILIRHTVRGANAPELSILEGQEMSAGESFQLSTISSTEESFEIIRSDLRRLTHTEARQWRYTLDNKYAVRPDTPSVERDLDRTAWREIVVGRSETQSQPVSFEDKTLRSVLLQEVTAFHRMPRQWFLPQSWCDPTQGKADHTFHPAVLRMRLAPDKPGAMMHQRLQFISAEPQPSSPPSAGSTDSRFHLGASVDFSLREPMQLNPPLGSSIKLMNATYSSLSNQSGSRISFEWQETLGTIPIVATGTEMVIRQLLSQQAEGVDPTDVRLEIMPKSQHCLQLIVQINDQLIDLDERQPLFPVYDARQAANTKQVIALENESNMLAKLITPLPDATYVELRTYKRNTIVLAKSETALKAYSVHDPQAPADIELGSKIAPEDVVTLTQDIDGAPVILAASMSESKVQAFRLSNMSALTLEQSTFTVLDVAAAKAKRGAKAFETFAALERDGNNSIIHFWIPNADDTKYVRHSPKPPEPGEPVQNCNRLALAGDESNFVFAVCWDEGKSQWYVWRLTLSEKDQSQDKLEKVATIVASHTGKAVALHSAQIGDSREPVLFVAEDDGYVRSYDQNGHVTREIPVPQPVNSMSLNVETGRPLLTISTGEEDTRRVSIIDVESGRVLREVTSVSRAGRLVMLGDRPVLVCFDGGNQIHCVETYLSNRRPPNIFLASAMKEIYEEVKVDVTVKTEGNGKETKNVTLVPMLVLELLNTAIGELEVPIELTSFIQPVPSSVNGYTLYQFDSKMIDLKLDQAKTIRISWRRKISDRDSTELDNLEVVYGGSAGKKKLRLVPYASTAAKCCAVLVVDVKEKEKEGFLQVMHRNLIFGDAANASSGKGILRSTNGSKPLFAFEAEERETVETPLPTINAEDQIGLVLVKYFADGQTLRTQYNKLMLKPAD